MTQSEQLESYILKHIEPEPDYLYRLYRATNIHLLNGRMASGHLQGRLLKMMVQMIRPRNILEVGTFSGYSAISMAEALTPDPTDGIETLHTIEVFDELEDFIRENLGRAGDIGRKITLHLGDALQLIPEVSREVEKPWDVVFIDADKRHYTDYYEMVLPHVRQGGLILADNTLWDGKVLDPQPKESDQQTRALQHFNDLIVNDKRVEKVILPMRDGLTIIRKL